MFKITATIIKPGNPPVAWVYFSKEKLTVAQCEKMLNTKKEVGRSYNDQARVENFCCQKINP